MDSKRFTRRLVALGAAMFLCALVFVVTLFDAQIVNGDDYLAQSIRTNAKSETVKASRGVITDRNGKVLVSNRAVYTLNFDSSLVSSDELNDALLRVIDLMNAQGVEIVNVKFAHLVLLSLTDKVVSVVFLAHQIAKLGSDGT